MITAKHISFILVLLVAFSSLSFSQVTSAASGDWGDGATWVGGTVPAPNADVLISNDHKVVLNVDATVNNLTVDGTLEFEDVTARTLTVNGNVNADSIKTKSLPGAGPLIHSLVLYGHLTVQSLFDLRYGSNPNVGAADISILGNTNSTLTGPSNMDVNGVTINKTGGAKVILGSDFIQNNNSSNLPLGILNLTEGIIETGSFEWRVRATGSAAGVQGGSVTSYVNGNLVLYMPSGASVKTYPLGDGDQYRPLTVYLGSSVSNSGVKGFIVHGNANTGSSIFSGNIDKVSAVRYFGLQNISNNNLQYYSYAPSYGLDDGVTAGNTDLRVATSDDDRATWLDRGTYGTHTTDLTNPPTFIQSDSTSLVDTLSSQEIIYVSLARTTGTTTNTLPVELIGFSASINGNEIILRWTTASEVNNRGFEIERSMDNNLFQNIGFVPGAGTSSETNFYSITSTIEGAGTYYYRLKQIDYNGVFTYSSVINIKFELPVDYSLSQNYPNPFNPVTSIHYQLPEAGFVTLKVYDILGNEVATLINENKELGAYTVNVNLSSLSSGTYVYELKVNSFVQRNKMMLLK